MKKKKEITNSISFPFSGVYAGENRKLKESRTRWEKSEKEHNLGILKSGFGIKRPIRCRHLSIQMMPSPCGVCVPMKESIQIKRPKTNSQNYSHSPVSFTLKLWFFFFFSFVFRSFLGNRIFLSSLFRDMIWFTREQSGVDRESYPYIYAKIFFPWKCLRNCVCYLSWIMETLVKLIMDQKDEFLRH